MIHYCCDRCELALDREYKARVYVLPDGRETPMEQRHVWCGRCATIAPAEMIEVPRCLRCGNVDVSLPAHDLDDLPHPCGGVLRCTFTLVGGTGPRCRPHRYSVDGALLEQGAVLGMFADEPDAPYELF